MLQAIQKPLLQRYTVINYLSIGAFSAFSDENSGGTFGVKVKIVSSPLAVMVAPIVLNLIREEQIMTKWNNMQKINIVSTN